jgi:Fe-S-cluster-containing hydrogenase component 2
VDTQNVWLDEARCSGCGACVRVCPEEAIAVVRGKALLDTEACTGCVACVAVCPTGALVPVTEGELVPAPERPSSVVRQPSPLMRPASAAVAMTGAGLLIKVGSMGLRTLGRWLLGRPTAAWQSTGGMSQPRRPGVGGRQTRRRWRGG